MLLLASGGLYACGGLGLPTSGGEIKYSIDSTQPLTVNVTLTMYFDRTESLPTDSVVLNWGDGTSSAIYANNIDTDFYALGYMPYNPLFNHVYSGSHTYTSFPVGGYYFIGTTGEYHVSDIDNLNGGSGELQYYIETQVGMDSLMDYFYIPPTLQPVNLMFSGLNSFTDTMLAAVPKADSVVFELVPALLAHGIPVPNFILPSQVCNIADTSFVINSQTGVINWPNVCLQGIFDVTTRTSTYRNGKLIGTVMRDQLLYTAISGPSAISDLPMPGSLTVYPNPTNSVLNIALPANAGTGQIILYDISGKEIFSERATNNTMQTLDISGLTPGIYLLTYETSSGKCSERIVKQ